MVLEVLGFFVCCFFSILILLEKKTIANSYLLGKDKSLGSVSGRCHIG